MSNNNDNININNNQNNFLENKINELIKEEKDIDIKKENFDSLIENYEKNKYINK
jgi:DNA-binding transcriptional regulator YhcF (GntR family)